MKSLGRIILAMVFAAGAVAELAFSQTESSMPKQKTACSADEYGQFDFWIGEWVVHDNTEAKKVLGHSRIARDSSGCWLSEHWQSASGPAHDGTSLNTWDAQYGVWRQFWVGADAGVLRLEGKFREGAMVLQGELPDAKGGVQLQKITWTPNRDGTVTQHWETSDDNGVSWQNSFLGVYERVAKSAQ